MQELSGQIASKELESELVFAISNIGIYQNDSRASFTLQLHCEQVELKLCALMAFRKKIMRIDLTDMFMPSHPGIEIVSLPQLNRIFIFSLQEILELRDLFSGAMTMLEINSVIHEKLFRGKH